MESATPKKIIAAESRLRRTPPSENEDMQDRTPLIVAPLTARAMARVAGVPSAWLRREADAGRIPSLRAGGVYLFHRDAVLRVLADRAAQTTEVRHAN